MKNNDYTYLPLSTIENTLEETIGSSIKSFYLGIKELDIENAIPSIETITEDAITKRNAYNLIKNNSELQKESKKITERVMNRHQEVIIGKKLLTSIVNLEIGPLLYKIDDNYITITRENFSLALTEMQIQTLNALEDSLLLSTIKKLDMNNDIHLGLMTKYQLHPDHKGKVTKKELIITSNSILETCKQFITTLCASTITSNYMVPTNIRANDTLDKLETYNYQHNLYKKKDNHS